MHLPEKLQKKVDELLEKSSPSLLKRARQLLTEKYREGAVSDFHDEANILAYLAARMPATFSAITHVLKNTNLQGHLLDIGAGPGTASWAAIELFPQIEKVTLIEQSAKAVQLGKFLAKEHPKLSKAEWLHQTVNDPLPHADVVILSYLLNELKNPEEILQKCIDAANTLVIIEPGTPKAFENIRKIRMQLIDSGLKLLAPCPHHFQCPILKGDWCHFSQRVERTKLHRMIKEGTLGYEDEKFCYLIASKKQTVDSSPRIIRRPLKKKGHIQFTLCMPEGNLETRILSKKEGEIYREGKRLEWGDSFKIRH